MGDQARQILEQDLWSAVLRDYQLLADRAHDARGRAAVARRALHLLEDRLIVRGNWFGRSSAREERQGCLRSSHDEAE